MEQRCLLLCGLNDLGDIKEREWFFRGFYSSTYQFWASCPTSIFCQAEQLLQEPLKETDFLQGFFARENDKGNFAF